MDHPVILRIEGLKTYFHTYEGVVRALEGIDLEIRSGETVGLVGETGCGKSVTALSILRLVPSPPGKIEAGRVFLEEPDDVHEIRLRYEEEAAARLSEEGNTPPDPKAIEVALAPIVGELKAKQATAASDGEKRELRRKLDAATCAYELLRKPEEDMRAIRGNKISMIFQEPMTALNPVFSIGDQIAETLVLHNRAELCRNVLKTLDREMAARARGARGRRITVAEARAGRKATEGSGGTGGPGQEREQGVPALEDQVTVCSECLKRAPSLWDYCPSCGARLTFDLWSPFRGWIMSTERKLYTRMLADSQDQLVDFVNTMRGLRRFVRARLRDEGLRIAVERLREVKIPEPEVVAGQYPFELSGGMRQRSMIAMMMACNPRLLIADEPTTALDVTVEAQILKLMKELQAKTTMSILLITHDLGIVAEVCDRVGVMYAGSIAEFGTTEQIFHRTRHPYTSGLMQSIPRFKGSAVEDRKKELYIIHGTVPNLLHPPSGCRFHPRCPRAIDRCKDVVPSLEEVEPGHFVACHNPAPLGEAVP